MAAIKSLSSYRSLQCFGRLAQSHSSGNLVNVLLIISIVDVSPEKMLRLHGERATDGHGVDDDAVSQTNDRRIMIEDIV